MIKIPIPGTSTKTANWLSHATVCMTQKRAGFISWTANSKKTTPVLPKTVPDGGVSLTEKLIFPATVL